MRVIFVGIHQKPYKQPLDSSTKTGKIIDEVIGKLKTNVVVRKTNLYDQDHMPDTIYEKIHLAKEWHDKNQVELFDVVVLLGKEVQENYLQYGEYTICVNHPASIYTGKNKYIQNLAESINGYL